MLLIALAEINNKNYLSAIFFLLCGLMTLPPTYPEINKALKFKINSSGLRLILIITLFFIGIGSLPNKVETVSPAQTASTTQKQVSAVNSAQNQQVEEQIVYPSLKEEGSEYGTVTFVVDGDTIHVDVSGSDMNIRLIGIDTPEIHHPSEPIQCYGPEAKTTLENLILNKEVTLEKDVSDKDQYDRYLRYVWVGETLVNEYMTKNGYAFSSSYPPNTKYQVRINAGQVVANANLLGLWAKDTCNGDVYTGTYKDPNKTVTPPMPPTVSNAPEPSLTPKPNPKPAPQPSPSSSSYTCNCSKTCGQMALCDEAYFQLNNCGCSARDGDNDGVPCESICR